MNRIPSTQALQCFEASARLGSFTQAGLELHLTQGGISRQIAGLERRLGFALLQRRRDGLRLTPAGQAYLCEIEPALRALERATSNVMALKGQGGILNLSLPASWGNHWLIPRLGEFTAAHPQIGLNILTKIGPADFSNRQVDAAVEFRREARSDMPSEFVMGLSLAPYASPQWRKAHHDEITPQAMLQHTTIPAAWSGWLAAHAPAQRHGAPLINPAQGARYDLMFMAMNAAVAGLGVALLPDFMAEPLVASRKLSLLAKTRWSAPGGYFLTQSPLLRSDAPFLIFRDWLRVVLDESASGPRTLRAG